MNRIVHFEIPAADPEKCMNFYKTVFGWSFHAWGEGTDYYLAQTGDNSAPGINGAVMKRRDPAQPVVNTLDVSDIDATAGKIEENGGQIVVPKMAGHRLAAVFQRYGRQHLRGHAKRPFGGINH